MLKFSEAIKTDKPLFNSHRDVGYLLLLMENIVNVDPPIEVNSREPLIMDSSPFWAI